MTIDTKTIRLCAQARENTGQSTTADVLRRAADRIDAQAAEIERLRKTAAEVIQAFERIGNSPSPIALSGDRAAAEKALVALKDVLGQEQGESNGNR